MKRRFFGFASALSLLLCVATVVLWARSYWQTDEIVTYASEGCGITIVARGSLIHLYQPYATSYGGALKRQWRIGQPALTTEGVESMVETSGTAFRSGHFFTSMAHDEQWWSVPLWWFATPLALLLSLLPACWLWLRWRARRGHWQAAICRHCGYDLRASAERCPECGTPVPKKAEAAT